jgi:hypothetical protein
MAGLKLLKRIKVTAKDGTVLSDTGLIPAHSFVKNFLCLLAAILWHAYDVIGGVHYDIVDHLGATKEFYMFANLEGDQITALRAPANNDAYGIQVGTDSTTPTNADYDLNAKIADGTGTGELNYGEPQQSGPTIDGQAVKWTTSRTFENTSGATITVREIGMMTYSHLLSGTMLALISHDTFSDVDVINGATLQITYVFETTIDES